MTSSSFNGFVRTAIAAGILIPLVVIGCDSSKETVLTGPPPAAPPPAPPPAPGPPPPVGAFRAAATARGFLVGTAVEVRPLQQAGPYRDTAGVEYNLLEPENAMKFSVIHPTADSYDFRGADSVVGFATARGMAVRGNSLVWHNQLPSWVTNQLSSSDYSNCSNVAESKRVSLRTILRDHITTLVARYRGKVAIWDVVNEAFDDSSKPKRRNTIWQCALGPTYIDSAFVWARLQDADARLFYNDYGAEGTGVKADSVYNLVSSLRLKSVPVDGVGLQMHGGLSTSNAKDFKGPTSTSVAQNMDKLIGMGVEVEITEMDVKLINPTPAMWQAQGRVYAEMLGVCLARPRCTAFVTWGFTDLWTWDNPGFPKSGGWTDPLPFDQSYLHKPAFDSLLARVAH